MSVADFRVFKRGMHQVFSVEISRIFTVLFMVQTRLRTIITLRNGSLSLKQIKGVCLLMHVCNHKIIMVCENHLGKMLM